jgi:phage anti-repressor protein
MSEAKKSGSLDERLEHENIQQQQFIEKLQKEYGFPENAKFCGYIVHQFESDQFLIDVKITSSFIYWAFAKEPDLAKRFESQADAEKVSKRCKKKTNVALLFDAGDQFCVMESE